MFRMFLETHILVSVPAQRLSSAYQWLSVVEYMRPSLQFLSGQLHSHGWDITEPTHFPPGSYPGVICAVLVCSFRPQADLLVKHMHCRVAVYNRRILLPFCVLGETRKRKKK